MNNFSFLEIAPFEYNSLESYKFEKKYYFNQTVFLFKFYLPANILFCIIVFIFYPYVPVES